MLKTPARSLAHLRYWPAWALISILQLLVMLPHSWLVNIGKFIGYIFYLVPSRRRQIAATNLALCFPELDPKAHQRLLKRTMQANIIGFLEAFISWLKPGKMPATEFIGRELVDDFLAQKKGILLVGAHFTTIDIAGRMFGSVYPFNVIYRPQNNPIINAIMERGRNEFLEAEGINQHDIRGMVRSLKDGKILWFPADQDHGVRSSVFAPFFGIEAATLDMPSRLIKLTNAKLIFASYFRKPDHSYVIRFEEVPGFGSGDHIDDASRLNRTLEARLREFPEQYMWVHRRFKTRPTGEPAIYNTGHSAKKRDAA